ncbi:MAG: OmpA family protein [Bacteroidota bacterium]
MTRFFLIASLCFWLGSTLSGQEPVSVMVNFEHDTFNLLESEKTKINEQVLGLDAEIITLSLLGHTDSDGADAYNLDLSRKRVNTVKSYLVLAGIDESVISTSFFGERNPVSDNETETGKYLNRRVEIIIITSHPKVIVEDIVNEPPYTDSKVAEISEPNPPPPQKKDTTISQGLLQITMNNEEYEKLKDCLVFTPILDAEAALENNYTTITVNNRRLASCGMIKIELKEPCEGCFDHPVKIRYPALKPQCLVCDFVNIYSWSEGGGWESRPEESLEKLEINGKDYYEMTVICPGSKNCDCLVESIPVKFNFPEEYKVIKMNVVSDCPLVNYPLVQKSDKKHQMIGELPCELAGRKSYAYFTVVNEQKDTIEIRKVKLNDFRHSIKKKCKYHLEGRFLGVFPKYRDKIFVRYRLKPKMMTRLEEKSKRYK